LRVHPDICGLHGLHRAHRAVSTTSWVFVRVWGLGRCRSGSSPSHLALVSEPPSRPAAGFEVDPEGPSSRPATPRLRFFTPPPTSLPPFTPGSARALPSGRPDQGRLPFRPRGFAPPRRLSPATGSRFVAPWCRPWGSPRSPDGLRLSSVPNQLPAVSLPSKVCSSSAAVPPLDGHSALPGVSSEHAVWTACPLLDGRRSLGGCSRTFRLRLRLGDIAAASQGVSTLVASSRISPLRVGCYPPAGPTLAGRAARCAQAPR